MDEKQLFYDWWKSNGCRGISYCENNYDKITKRTIRKILKRVSTRRRKKENPKTKDCTN